jgi:hypothetical protein
MRFTYVVLPGALCCGFVFAAACGGSGAQNVGATGAGGLGGGTTSASTTAVTSSSSSGSADAGDEMASTTYPAPHASPPQVVSLGGTIIASPKLVPVFFSNANATYQAETIDFLNRVGGTKYWAAATSEYGVGPAVALAPVLLTETAPGAIDDATIQTWLATKLMGAAGTGGGSGGGGAGGAGSADAGAVDGGDDAGASDAGASDAGADAGGSNADGGAPPVWPAPDENTLYVLHYPATTRITLQSGSGASLSCQDFGGYHNSANVNGQDVAYAVVPTCVHFDSYHGIDAITGSESHELIEAVTDPHPETSPAYVEPDDAHVFWEAVLGGGEVGDMCAQFPGAFTDFAELPYLVQRTWSNASAKAGHDPCVPELPGEVYFNAAPQLNDAIPFSFGQPVTLRGVKIPVGATKTIVVDLFSEGDTGGPWTVSVQEAGAFGQRASSLSMSLDQSTGQNGDQLHLSITANQAGPYDGLSFFVLTSSNATLTTEWVGVVGN